MRRAAWGCLFGLAFCHGCAASVARPPEAVVPPRPEYAPDQLPPAARRIRVPPWATLEAVWGQYDPFFPHPAVAAFADDHTLVLSAGGGELRLWDIDRREERLRVEVCVRSGDAHRVLSVSGSLAVVGSDGGHVCLVDLKSGARVLAFKAHDAIVLTAKVIAEQLVTYGYQSELIGQGKLYSFVEREEGGGEVRRWDLRTGRLQTELVVGPVQALAIANDGSVLASRNGHLTEWDAAGTVQWEEEQEARVVAFASPDRWVIMGADEIQTRALRGGTSLGWFRSAESLPKYDTYEKLAVTADGRFAITRSSAATIILWDVRARREITRHHLLGRGERYTAALRRSDIPFGQWHPPGWTMLPWLALSPDGSLFATWPPLEPAVLWRTARLERLGAQPRGRVVCLGFTRSGRRALTRDSRGRIVRLWDVATGRQLRTWTFPDASTVRASPDGEHFGVKDRGEVELRSATTGRPRWAVEQPTAATFEFEFSGDGQYVVVEAERGTGGTVVRHVASGRVAWNRPDEYPRGLSFDGRNILTAGKDRRAQVRGVSDGVLERQFGELDFDIRQLTLLRDDRALVRGSHSIGVYDFGAQEWLWTSERRGERESVRWLARCDDVTFFSLASTVRLRSLQTGQDVAPPLDIAPSNDSPVSFIVSSDCRSMLVGTQRGVVLRLAIRPPVS